MASTFENDLRLEEIGTGEQSGTWGATTNTNLELIAEAFSYGTEAITTNADTHATVIADGSTDEGRSMYLKYTGALDSTCTITISAGSAGTFTLSKVWLIENATSGGQDIIVTSGSGASITIKNGQVKMVASDGAGSGGIMYDLLQDVAIPDLFIDDDLTFQSDGAIINFGENSEIQLTHVHDTGLLLTETGGGAPTLQFRDSAISISSSADATLDLAADGDINLTAGVDINIPANVGLTFGNDGEKIEGDGTDLTIAGNNINLTASEDVVIPANIGILFGTGEKIEGDNTDLTITSGAKINLTATTDVHLPNNIGLVFGDTGEKIEGDGTNLAINSSGDVNITATTVDLDGNLEVSGSITLGSGAVISEAELETIDGVTAGTVSASKALVVDSNKKLNELTIDDVAIDGKVITMTGDTSDTVTITAGTNGTLAITTTDAAAAAANITITADGTFEAVGTTITLDSSGGINLETDALSIGNNEDTDVAVTFNGNSNDGVITWMEDEDYFQFSDDILMATTEKIQFRDTASFIHSSADGTLTIEGEAIIDLNASTRVDVSVDIKVGGEVQTAKIAFTDGDDAITVADGGGITAAAGITSTAASNTFGATSFNDANITNVADIALDSISADGTDINIAVSDNSATALTIKQGSDAYLIIDTANSSESVSIGTGISGTAITIGHSTSEVTVADNLTVNGDLTVSGTTTTVNSTTVNLNDHNIVLDSGNSTSAVINGAGITIEGGSGDDATFTYNTTGPKFELKLGSNHEDLQVDGLIASTGTFSGILKTDDTTDATSTTDGSLQTDGGLSVAKDAIFGNDVKLLSDSSVLVFGAGSDVTLTHSDNTGLTLNSTNKIMFNDASQFIQGSSATVLSLGATDEIDLTATAIDINGNADVSGTLDVGGDVSIECGTNARLAIVDNVGEVGSGNLALQVGNTAQDALKPMGFRAEKFIFADGNVGIGEENPATELEIAGTGDVNGGVLTIDDAGSLGIEIQSGDPTVLFKEDDTTNENYQIRLSSGDLLFQTQNDARNSAATKMTILSTGKVTMSNFLSVGHTNAPSYGVDIQTADTTAYGLRIKSTEEGGSALIRLESDQADDNHDYRNIIQDSSGNFRIQSYNTGSFVDQFKIAASGAVSTPTLGTSNTRLGENAGDAIVSGGNYNVLIGDEAGTAITTGDNNVAVGFEALMTEDQHGNNTAIGYRALKLLDAGAEGYNVAVGSNAGAALDDGLRNVLVGSFAGASLEDQADNVAIGDSALNTDTQGTRSVAIGRAALATQNFTGGQTSFNTAIGYYAGNAIQTGQSNTLVGYESGLALTTGFANTVLGSSALSAEDSGRYNTAIGAAALETLNSDTDNFNTAVGYQAAQGTSVSTFIQTVAVGAKALHELQTGNYNVAVGFECQEEVTVGDYNTAVGTYALKVNQNGDRSTAFGYSALLNQSPTGVGNADYQNVAVGAFAGLNLSTGKKNVFLGYEAGHGNASSKATGDDNVFIGNQAGKVITTGGSNVLIGAQAGDVLTTGVYNVALGTNALGAETTGNNSTAIGQQSLGSQFTETDSHNTGCGYLTGYYLTTGVANTFIGSLSGFGSSSTAHTGDQNTCVGYRSGHVLQGNGNENTLIGSNAGLALTTGDQNTLIGTSAGSGGTLTGSTNVCVGYATGHALTSGGNNLLLGSEAGRSNSPSGNITSGSNNVCLGDDNISNLFCADTSISSSDSRDKADITDFTIGLNWIKDLRPVTYKWDKRSWYGTDEEPLGTPDGSKKKSKVNIGFLAQEALEVEKANGFGDSADNMLVCNLTEDGQRYGMKYERLVPILVNAVKELSAKVTALEAEVTKLKGT